MIARLELAITCHREMPGRASATIIGVLERMVAADRAELEAEPEPEHGSPPVSAAADVVTWASACFHAAGYFDPFAGSYREAMLASAATCERLGCHQIAAGYRRRAESEDPGAIAAAAPEGGPIARKANRWRDAWTGPPMQPPEPMPFIAGEQIGFPL